MKYCTRCGTKLNDNSMFCQNCGSKINDENIIKEQNEPKENKNVGSESESGKVMGILCYIGILVLIPYFSEKNNSFVIYHAKQGLNLFICEIIATVVVSVIGRMLYMFYYFTSIVELAMIILSIIGIVYVCQGEKKELPIIGSVKFIK